MLLAHVKKGQTDAASVSVNGSRGGASSTAGAAKMVGVDSHSAFTRDLRQDLSLVHPRVALASLDALRTPWRSFGFPQLVRAGSRSA